MNAKRVITTVSADTTTGAVTGKVIYVGNHNRLGILLRRTGGSVGNTVFTFKGSFDALDGSNAPTMTALNVMDDDLTNTNAQQLTRVNSKTLSTNTDALLWLDWNAIVNFIEIDYNTTTDGAVTIEILLEEDED